MLKKENRLRTKFEFNVTRKYGKRYTGNYFQLYVARPTGYEGPFKAGIVISNKIHKRAVARNRLKRLFRETLRDNAAKLKPGFWLILYPASFALGKSYEEISSDFNKTIQKVSFS